MTDSPCSSGAVHCMGLLSPFEARPRAAVFRYPRRSSRGDYSHGRGRARHPFFVHWFVASAEIFGKEFLFSGGEVETIFGPAEPVTFVGIQRICRTPAVFLDGGEYLFRLRGRNALIVGALADQNRNSDLMRRKKWRSLLYQFPVFGDVRIADFGLQQSAPLPVCGERHDEREQIGWSAKVDRAAIQIWGERRAGERCVSTIRAPINRYALRIRDSSGHRPCHGIGEIVLHFATKFAISRMQEFLSVADRPAIVDLQHRIATIRK